MVDRTAFDLMMQRRAQQVRTGWIGVDFDGTMATYDEWVAWHHLGEPIEPMISRVRRWLGEGHEVRILTARIGLPVRIVNQKGRFYPQYDGRKNYVCRVTGEKYSPRDMSDALGAWSKREVGTWLVSQCYKDVDMIELWDDRVVQVESNTGRTVFDAFEAEVAALRGAP